MPNAEAVNDQRGNDELPRITKAVELCVLAAVVVLFRVQLDGGQNVYLPREFLRNPKTRRKSTQILQQTPIAIIEHFAIRQQRPLEWANNNAAKPP
jgi:hypothetical protein